MEFRILGPLEVVEQGAPLPIGAQKQRAVLAALLLARGEPVSVERLADAVWGERPPPTATKSLQVYVSHLRKALGGALETRGKAYRLLVEPGQLDAECFELLLARGRELLAAGKAREAAGTLREALGLWRGPPLAEFAYEPFAQAEISRLDELRMSALQERIDADLALGRHSVLVGELESLVREHPLSERLRGQLMLALYGCGRQAEALEAYQRARDVLVEQLGIEPGPTLRDIHAAVLHQDPQLGTAARASVHVRARRRSGLLVALGGAALSAAAVLAAALAVLGADDPPAIAAVRPLPASFCSPLQYAAEARPRLLLVADQDLHGQNARLGNEIAAAVEHVMREHGFRAGRHAVAYQACDGSPPPGATDAAPCRRNARAYAANRSVVGVVGPMLTTCATQEIPIANSAPGGPLAMVSPSNTHVGLTRQGIGAAPGEPGVHYPSGVRNYVRLMPADDLQAAAHAMLADRLGARAVFVMSEGVGRAAAAAFRQAAEKLGLRIAGQVEWEESAPDYRGLAREARRSRADTVFLAGALASNGAQLLSDLRAAVDPDVRVLATDGFAEPEVLRDLGERAERMAVSVPGVAPAALQGAGRRLVTRLRADLDRTPHQFAVYAAQAAELLLQAVARSDGTRPSVVRQLFATHVRDGILGDFAVMDTGDTTATQVTMYRVRSGRLELDEVLRPPVSLVVPSG